MKVKEHYLQQSFHEPSTFDTEYHDLIMNQVIEECTLPDYVVIQNGQHCYLSIECDPEHNVCSCNL